MPANKPSLTTVQEDVIRDLYANSPTSSGNLPYTDEFECMFAQFAIATGLVMSVQEFWLCVAGLRKDPKKGLSKKFRQP